MASRNLLLELGTEELPPRALRRLAEALHEHFTHALKEEGFSYAQSRWYATPRRLALEVRALEEQLPDREVEIRGPSLASAYDADGKPTRAALNWAAAQHVELKDVGTVTQGKGSYLCVRVTRAGRLAREVVVELFGKALAALPVPKLMHWGAHRFQFVRPVHTFCALFGDELLEGELYGIKASRTIRGHRFLGAGEITLKHADEYVKRLRDEGKVIADYEERKAAIVKQVQEIARAAGGKADLDEALLEEVTSIVELPQIYRATFEERFLKVPPEALVYTMKGDQKYFPIYAEDGRLLPVFALVSNICPDDPTEVIAGNERVVRPRLSDAEFFFEQDRKHRLESFAPRLERIVYQKDLGTIAERVKVVAKVCEQLCPITGADPQKAARAAALSKCDLATTMVSEFTDTQGIMGMYYARLDGEDEEVAVALKEAYQPRFAGDELPTNAVAVTLNLSDKLVTLTGIFGIGQLPKGDKDPYSLRRAAIGLVRIALEKHLDFSVPEVLKLTLEAWGKDLRPGTAGEVEDYIFTRLRGLYQDQGIDAGVFAAVRANRPSSILDFNERIKAVNAFRSRPEAQDLAALFKRIRNIVAKSGITAGNAIDTSLLQEDAERVLYDEYQSTLPALDTALKKREYHAALTQMSHLRPAVDRFFKEVMVNAEDAALKSNRIALLSALQNSLSQIADITVLY